jgi:hypothetical protein
MVCFFSRKAKLSHSLEVLSNKVGGDVSDLARPNLPVISEKFKLVPRKWHDAGRIQFTIKVFDFEKLTEGLSCWPPWRRPGVPAAAQNPVHDV